ncbi:TIM barrel protein [Salmonirosea aquatica]|uniref:TIM barrel protein n=1 Tax=Salmonirosea aquatica TaxID=2654236 RepID=A0A7C9BD01_9BACT|nr:TIM barrel protein [Cytophagaceae bacterium SJW1-29]
MKLSIAIADTHARPSAFVVYRGFELCIPKAATLGFKGVELALKRAEEIDPLRMQTLLEEHQMEISCISTGQVYADDGLMFTDPRIEKRQQVRKVFKELIDLAENFGGLVNIGRVRGQIGEAPRAEAENLFIEMAQELCDYAAPRQVTLILEPVNRYEIDFVNNVEEGVGLMQKVNRFNMMLMPDVFHMNIEDRAIGPELARHIDHVRYIHLADSNRLAPGQGHLDFPAIFEALLEAEYDGWVSAEILPLPDPDQAARQTAEYLLPLIDTFNRKSSERWVDSPMAKPLGYR